MAQTQTQTQLSPLSSFSDQQLAQIGQTEPWKLYQMRDQYKNQADQNRLAGFEHQAYARGTVAQNPLMAVPIGVSTVGYDLAKLAGAGIVSQARSQPSLTNMGMTFQGIGQGLQQAGDKIFNDLRQEVAKLAGG